MPTERFLLQSEGGPSHSDIDDAVIAVGKRRGILEHISQAPEESSYMVRTLVLGRSDEDSFAVSVIGEFLPRSSIDRGIRTHMIAPFPEVIVEVREELLKNNPNLNLGTTAVESS